MGLRYCFFLLLFFLLLLGFAAPSYIKYEVLENAERTAGRFLLQEKQDCPIDMENQNYTIVTSQCKGPKYDGKVCCGAFKELACKNRDALNAENNCATVMFNYLHLYGKYPPGLFGNLCKEDKNGLDCKQVDEKQAAAAAAAAKSAAGRGFQSSAVLLAAAAALIALF